jgi:hypothetical protein
MAYNWLGFNRFPSCNPLERLLVTDYLFMQGYFLCDLEMLPFRLRSSLLEEACNYAQRMLYGFSFDDHLWLIPEKVAFSIN